LTELRSLIVVGAGLAGWRCCEEFRRRGFAGPITLIGDESHLPYDRPPLSKQVLSGQWPVEQTLLATPERLERARVTLRLADPAVALDSSTNVVTLASGDQLSASHVVIATGARSRHLPFGEGLVRYLRSIDDLTGLRRELAGRPEPRVVVIGGGFIGAEVATSLHKSGVGVTVLEASARPLVQVLGETVSTWLADLPSAAGVTLRSNQLVRNVYATSDGLAVDVEGYDPLLADIVLAGVGAVANVEWLASSAVPLDNGVVVDSFGQVSERLAAIGDVARFVWDGPAGSERVRIEHWQVASDHAARLAQVWVRAETPTTPLIPYFWSDQYGKKIQAIGHASPHDEVDLVHGSLAEGKWLAMYSRGGVVTGFVGLSQPRALTLARPLLERAHSRGEALALAPWLPEVRD
jgi:NADPH-dependent 2,4-dienoyl-CoA reductase/sulfur reductase-like enzyme